MKYSVIIILLLLGSTQSFSQIRRAQTERTSISFGTQIELPKGEFLDIYGGNPVGIGGTFVTKNSFPFLYTGLNFTYARMSKFTDDVTFQDGVNNFGTPVFESADATLKSKVARVHAVARFEPFKGKVQPYVEGLIGAKVFSSNLKIENDINGRSEVVSKDNLERSLAGSLGYAFGLKIQLSPGLFAEGRVDMLTGSNARYIDKESVFMDLNDEFQYNLLESRTNSTLIHIGFSLEI